MKNILIALFLILTISVYGQEDSTKVSFVAYWSIGDSYDFEVTKTTQQWKKDSLIKDDHQKYLANFTVIDSTASSYTINWRYENNLSNKFNFPKKLQEKLTKYKITDVKYKTSELGEFIEVINWKQIGEMMNNLFDDMTDVLVNNNPEAQKNFEKYIRPFKQIYSSKQGIEMLVLKEIQYFHFPMGLEYTVTEPIIYEDLLPNMLGGKPIEANGKITFRDINREEGFCVLMQELSLDPESTQKLIMDFFKEMGLKGKEIKKAFNESTFLIEDENTYEYYYYPGVPHNIQAHRESIIKINNEEGKRIDKVGIELVY